MLNAFKKVPCTRRIGSRLALGAALLTASAAAAPSFGQDGGEQKSTRDLIDDFSHWVFIAHLDMAEAEALALLERGIEPQEFLATLEDAPELQRRFEDAYRRALSIPQLEDDAAALWMLYEDGRRSRARMPEEIARNIQLLTGNRRAEILARERLMAAGEHAVPQLLDVLLVRQNPELEGKVLRLLVEMGRNAVAPLCAALLYVEPDIQERICRVLGQIPYRSSLPYLYELYGTSSSESVRAAAKVAITRIDGAFDEGTSVSRLYLQLGSSYYAETPSLVGFPDERYQILWSFIPGAGLTRTAILSDVFFEARAMTLAERALELDPADREALALWLASNLRREIRQDPNYDNPAYDASRRDAMYYAVAAGAGPMQDVLARAMADRDTRLARRAIEALSRSASGEAVWGGAGGDRSLVDALSYADRRVQYEAALALAHANPSQTFPGSDRVVPVLASIIREASNRYAVVIASDKTTQQELRTTLEGAGYIVLPPAHDLLAMQAAIADVAGVDLIVMHVGPELTMDLLSQIRTSQRLRATPVLAMMTINGMRRYGAEIENDVLSEFGREGLSGDLLVERVRVLTEQASGAAVTEEEAEAYAIHALEALSMLSMSSGSVYSVDDATLQLIDALHETVGDVRLKVADVLSRIGEKRAQVSLMDAAIEAEDEERIALLGYVTGSAKRFGNLLDDRQVEQLIEIAEFGLDDEATAAAALTGTLNLSNESLLPLILEAP